MLQRLHSLIPYVAGPFAMAYTAFRQLRTLHLPCMWKGAYHSAAKNQTQQVLVNSADGLA